MSKRQHNSGIGGFERNSNASVPDSTLNPNNFGSNSLQVPNQNIPMNGLLNSFSCPPKDKSEWSSYVFSKISNSGYSPQWNRQDELFFDPSRPKEMSLGFSRDEIEYAKFMEKKNKELERSMSDIQKRMLKALENEKILKLSRLEEIPDGK